MDDAQFENLVKTRRAQTVTPAERLLFDRSKSADVLIRQALAGVNARRGVIVCPCCGAVLQFWNDGKVFRCKNDRCDSRCMEGDPAHGCAPVQEP